MTKIGQTLANTNEVAENIRQQSGIQGTKNNIKKRLLGN